jgi:uncharacterized protein (TIGR00369 family)
VPDARIAPPDLARIDARVRASFARQRFMATLGATLVRVARGEVEIALPFDERLLQQHGTLHAGAVTAIADSACGYAALTVMPEDVAVLSAEFKVNLLAPADGERFTATGRVLKAGRTLVVCRGEVHAWRGGEARQVLELLGTMMTVRRPGLVD